jgi:hypothetical protein
MSVIENERIKLTATALNNIGVATFVTALVAPAVSFLYGAFIPGPHGWWLLIALGWCAAGIVLHFLARGILGRLQP